MTLRKIESLDVALTEVTIGAELIAFQFDLRERDTTIRVVANMVAGSLGVQLDGDDGLVGSDRATIAGSTSEYDIDIAGLTKGKRTLRFIARANPTTLDFLEVYSLSR